MQIKSIFRFLIPLIILLSLSKICIADVEIPFDYYYGRWVDGHQIGGAYEFRDDADDQSKQIDYLFTSGKYQSGFDIVRRYDLGVEGYGDRGWITPVVNFKIRPNSHWQIGIDEAYYAKSFKYYGKYQQDFYHHKNISNSGFLSLSSHWLSKNNMNLSKHSAKYSYYLSPLVGKGTLKIDNYFSINETIERDYNWDLRNNNSSTYLYTWEHYDRLFWYEFNNYLSYGLNDFLNLKFNLEYQFSKRDANNFQIMDRSGQYRSYSNSKSNSSRYIYSYDLSIISSYTNPFYLQIGLAQSYFKTDRSSEERIYDLINDTVTFKEWGYKYPFSVGRTDFMIGLHLLTTGEFDDNILLDNYKNFYGTMLFHNQFYSGLSLTISNRGNDQSSIDYSIAYGILGNFELRTNLNYILYDFYSSYSEPSHRNGETLTSEFIFKFRSYDYHPNKNYGWDRDNKYDIVLGEIQDLGEVKMEISYRPPVFSNEPNKERSFLSFDNLKSHGYASLNIYLSAGLGRGFGVEVRDSESYLDLIISRRNYNIEVCKRIFQKYKFSLKYEQTYVKSINHNISKTFAPTITATFKALF